MREGRIFLLRLRWRHFLSLRRRNFEQVRTL